MNTEPHPTHVILEPGMVTQEGDKHYYGQEHGGWCQATPGHTVREFQIFSRPIPSPWQSVNDPPEDGNEWVLIAGKFSKYTSRFDARGPGAAQWMRIPLLPEPTPEELSRAAFDNANISDPRISLFQIWQSGEKYGRGQV